MRKIILDTDIGGDIDDSITLAYLLMKKDCEILGITTVNGDVERRAKMVSAMCLNMGRGDIPIYPGAGNPLICADVQSGVEQADHLGAWPVQGEFPKYEAIEFMRKTIRENPGEVTLLPIGPLTNIALLFSVDPEIPKLIKDMYIMGGAFGSTHFEIGPRNEWNIACDPHAAKIVFDAGVKEHYVIGTNVTLQVKMNAEKFKEITDIKVMKPVHDFCKSWWWEEIFFHDPLAAAVMFNKDICGFERGKVDVDYKSDLYPGMTKFTSDENGGAYVALSVDPDKFFEEYFSAVK